MLVLGTYIVYYKSMVKVDTIRKINGKALYSMIAFGLIGLIHATLTILCAATLTYENTTGVDLSGKRFQEALVSAIVELTIFSLQLLCFYWEFKLSKKALETILKFHDYLTSYRLTPRSRILRKHLPQMTMVIEEGESSMDQSSMMLS